MSSFGWWRGRLKNESRIRGRISSLSREEREEREEREDGCTGQIPQDYFGALQHISSASCKDIIRPLAPFKLQRKKYNHLVHRRVRDLTSRVT